MVICYEVAWKIVGGSLFFYGVVVFGLLYHMFISPSL